MLAVSIKNLSHKINNKSILNNVNFELKKDSIACILGPSGSGKTTLLKLIAGLNKVQNGHILINDQEVSSAKIHLPTEKRRIGFLFQDYALFPHLTVEQNLLFGMNKNLKNKEKSLMISSYLQKSNMNGFQKRYPNTLSGGQKARIACLRAILSEPDALLLDEPFSSLDPDQRNSFRLFIIKQVQDRNIPCLLVT